MVECCIRLPLHLALSTTHLALYIIHSHRVLDKLQCSKYSSGDNVIHLVIV